MGRFPSAEIIREMVKWVGLSSMLILGARRSSISVVGYARKWCQSQLHRKSDSVVEAGRPATECD
jgi:hypothetical protein